MRVRFPSPAPDDKKTGFLPVIFLSYNKFMNFEQLRKHLLTIGDAKHASFSKSLSNSVYISIGVKNPVLKALVKENLKDEELKLGDFKLGEYLEVDFIYFALGVSRSKTVDEQLDFLDKNIYKAKSWAITDCVAPYIKKITFEKYWDFFKKNNDSKYVYVRRMSYILGLKFYKDKRILDVIPYIKNNEDYMVMMAEAWLLATVAIAFKDEIFDFLSECKDLTLKRKTISKISDSFRFTEEEKNRFKSLR